MYLSSYLAYYLYDMVVNRQNVGEKEWSKLMFTFHIIAWGVSAFCILLVGAFGHAGKDPDGESNNTGGWCWVHAETSRDLLLWELLGGKFIEWSSCLFVLPYLYSATIYRLILLDNGWDSLLVDNDSLSTSTSWTGKVERQSWSSNAADGVVYCYRSFVVCCCSCCLEPGDTSQNPSSLDEGLFSDHDEDSVFRLSDNNLSAIDTKETDSQPDTSLTDYEQHYEKCRSDSTNSSTNRERPLSHVSNDSSMSEFTEDTLGSLAHSNRLVTPDLSAGRISRDRSKVHSKPSFRQFYLKMVSNRFNSAHIFLQLLPHYSALISVRHICSFFLSLFLDCFLLCLFLTKAIVPVVFFLCRIWGSARSIIHFADPSSDSAASVAASTWLQTMQAIFDPALGFFNAVIFVFMSPHDRDAFFQIIFNAKLYRYCRNGYICTFVLGIPQTPPTVPVNTSSAKRATKQRVCYQGEDSEVSVSEEGGYRGRRVESSFSSHLDFNESSVTCNINTY